LAARWAGAVILALVAAVAPAGAVASPPCAGVRFLVDPLLVAGTALPFDVVVVDAAG